MFYIGVDLGGTNIAAGIVDEDGKIIKKGSVPTGRERSSQEVIKDMCELVKSLMNALGLSEKDIYSIGIGSPGVTDRKKGSIIYSCNLNFKNVPIREEIQKYIDVPVYVENDANCAAIAESVAGAAKGTDDSVAITIGTGIGGGIIINNKLYTGFNGAGGELGHVVIELNGEPCNCGRNGCWEVYSSATALIRQTRKAAQENPDSKINELCGGNLNNIDAKTAFDAARIGDETGKRVVDKYLEMMADGLANMVNIFQPELIVIGGGVSKEGENLLAPLREKMKGRTYCVEGLKTTRLVVAKMGNDAGIVGAAFIPKVQ